MAVISLAVTLILAPGLRPAGHAPETSSTRQPARQTEPQ
jgi:hypothetical protein